MLTLKFNNNIYTLGDWKYTEKWCVRVLLPHNKHIERDFSNGIGLHKNEDIWYPLFNLVGSKGILGSYYKMYPNKNGFSLDQLEQAKNHMDEFIRKLNSLKGFL